MYGYYNAAQEELEIEYNSRFDYVSEAYGSTAETGDDWNPEYTAEEIEEMKAAAEAADKTEGAFSFWYPHRNVAVNGDDIPF
jgi:hypothetical protein